MSACGSPPNPAIDETIPMLPLPCLIKTGNIASRQFSVPVKFVDQFLCGDQIKVIRAHFLVGTSDDQYEVYSVHTIENSSFGGQYALMVCYIQRQNQGIWIAGRYL